ncbi:Chromo domain-containing protein [Aphelenchoides fujianensis]|nr:Chromo domain-containing protein [Aphelenchoides fujianensis]
MGDANSSGSESSALGGGPIEAILGHRKVNGIYEYELKWKGYESDENTWQTADTFNESSIQLLEDYNRQHKFYEEKSERATPEKKAGWFVSKDAEHKEIKGLYVQDRIMTSSEQVGSINRSSSNGLFAASLAAVTQDDWGVRRTRSVMRQLMGDDRAAKPKRKRAATSGPQEAEETDERSEEDAAQEARPSLQGDVQRVQRSGRVQTRRKAQEPRVAPIVAANRTPSNRRPSRRGIPAACKRRPLRRRSSTSRPTWCTFRTRSKGTFWESKRRSTAVSPTRSTTRPYDVGRRTLLHRVAGKNCSVQHEYDEILACLVSQKASMEVIDGQRGQTALHIAVCNRHACLVRKLLELGSPINTVDREGLLAARRGPQTPPAVLENANLRFTPEQLQPVHDFVREISAVFARKQEEILSDQFAKLCPISTIHQVRMGESNIFEFPIPFCTPNSCEVSFVMFARPQYVGERIHSVEMKGEEPRGEGLPRRRPVCGQYPHRLQVVVDPNAEGPLWIQLLASKKEVECSDPQPVPPPPTFDYGQ